MAGKLLTLTDLVNRTGFSRSYFYNRTTTGAKTLKFVFTRPLRTTEEFYQQWIDSVAKEREKAA